MIVQIGSNKMNSDSDSHVPRTVNSNGIAQCNSDVQPLAKRANFAPLVHYMYSIRHYIYVTLFATTWYTIVDIIISPNISYNFEIQQLSIVRIWVPPLND